MKHFQTVAWFFGLVLGLGLWWIPGWSVAADGGQTNAIRSDPTETGSTNQPFSVALWYPRAAEPFHAPATITLLASVRVPSPRQPGEPIRIDFFANGNPIGAGQAIWHAGIQPDPQSRRAQPMIVRLPGYSPAPLVWSNIPAGRYTLSARATAANGTTVISPSAQVTVATTP
jgi:hypothetical protein